MKKIFVTVVVMALLCGVAFAESIDWAGMTDEELMTAYNNVSAELERRETIGNTENIVVFDEKDVSIIVTSFEIDADSWMYKPSLVANIKIINSSENDYEVFIDNVAINGWEVESLGMVDIAAGHKEKDKFEFNLEDADVESFDQLETMEIKFHYEDPDTYDYIYTDPVIISFK